MEQFYRKTPKKEELLCNEFEIPSGEKISFIAPLEDVYIDEQDFHAAEIYQGYFYYKEGKDDFGWICISHVQVNWIAILYWNSYKVFMKDMWSGIKFCMRRCRASRV